MKKLILLIPIVLVLGGCSRADLSTIKSWGAKHKVILWSGGKAVGTWYTTGQVQSEEGGGAYFQDDATHNPVEIYGTWSVEISQ
jgi:hypothetical protein